MSKLITTNDLKAIFEEMVTINGTDMTNQEVDDFVDSLNITGINAVDYVVEQGTSDGWSYRKWNSGRIIAEKNVTSGSTWTQVVSPIAHNTTALTPPTGMTVTSGYVNLLSTSTYLVSAQVQIYNGTVNLEAFRLSTGSATFDFRVTLIGTSS